MIKGQVTIEFLIILTVFFTVLLTVLVLVHDLSQIIKVELSALNAKNFLNELNTKTNELLVLENDSMIHLNKRIDLNWSLLKKGNNFIIRILNDNLEKQVKKEINHLNLEKELFFEKEINLLVKKNNDVISIKENT